MGGKLEKVRGEKPKFWGLSTQMLRGSSCSKASRSPDGLDHVLASEAANSSSPKDRFPWRPRTGRTSWFCGISSSPEKSHRSSSGLYPLGEAGAAIRHVTECSRPRQGRYHHLKPLPDRDDPLLLPLMAVTGSGVAGVRVTDIGAAEARAADLGDSSVRATGFEPATRTLVGRAGYLAGIARACTAGFASGCFHIWYASGHRATMPAAPWR